MVAMAEPRPSKKADLLQTGKTLMLMKGYAATSVDEICTAVGVTKGAFFYHFKSKEHFAASILEYVWQPIETARANIVQTYADPVERLQAHIDVMVEFVLNDARLIGIFMQALAKTHPEIAEQCQGYFRQWTQYHREDVAAAQAHYLPDTTLDVDSLVAHIMAAVEGLPVINSQMGRAQVDGAVAYLKQYVRILFGRQ